MRILFLLLFSLFVGTNGVKMDAIQIVKTLTKEEEMSSWPEYHHIWSDFPRTSGLTSITFCIRFQISSFTDARPAPTTHGIYALWGPGLDKSELIPPLYWPDRYLWKWDIYDPPSKINIGFDSELASFLNLNPKDAFEFVFNSNADHINIMEWHNVCMGYDTITKTYSHFQNGKKQVQFKHGYTVDKVSEFTNLTIGWGNVGIFTDMNVWNKLLSDQEMIDFTTCANMIEGTHFSWDINKWHINSTLEEKGKVKKILIRQEELCLRDMSKRIELFKPDGRGLNWESSDKLCRAFQGQLLKPPESFIEYEWQAEEFYRLFKAHPLLDAGYWMRGISAIYTTKQGEIPISQYTWIDPLDNRVLKTPPETILPEWVRWPEPSRKCYIRYTCGGEFDSCMWGRGVASQQRCSRVLGGAACTFEAPVWLTLRGLCSETKLDTTFKLLEPLEYSKDRAFGGTYGGSIKRNNVSLNWEIASPDNFRRATYNGSKLYPLGRNTWQITNDTCTGAGSVQISLILTACSMEQFTCDDGLCVGMDKRCDRKQDCEDLSDEKGCRLVSFDKEKYLKDIPPPPVGDSDENYYPSNSGNSSNDDLDEDMDSGINKLNVDLKVELIRILKIEEVNNVFVTQFKLEIIWKDSRLEYWNLKEDGNMNTLTEKEKQEIWIPKLVFHNTESKHVTLDDEKQHVSVVKHGDFKYNGIDTKDNIFVFKGTENYLVSKRIYDISWICEYNMIWYPFDTQKCSMEFVMGGSSGDFVKLIDAELTYSGPDDLTKYFIRSRSMKATRLDNGMFGVRVEVSLGRRLLATLMTVYFPTVLLNVIGHCTNFFKEFFFEAVITVNLTCMLVLTNMFINVSNNLPETSYIKMMDAWLIFNLILPFVEVLLHTYMDMLRSDDERSVNHHGTSVSIGEGVVNSEDKMKQDQKQPMMTLPNNVVTVAPADQEVKLDNDETYARAGVGMALVSRREDEQVAALKFYYAKLATFNMDNKEKLSMAKRFALYYNPILALTFVVAYWSLGIFKYNYPD